MTNLFNRNDGVFAQVDSGSISISTTTTTGFLTYVTKSSTVDIALGTLGLFIDGPAVSQGSSGTWAAWGSVTLKTSAAAANFSAVLWDGTTAIDAGIVQVAGSAALATISLAGVMASPAGNLRISGKDITGNTGAMVFNDSGTSRDCTITAIRIG